MKKKKAKKSVKLKLLKLKRATPKPITTHPPDESFLAPTNLDEYAAEIDLDTESEPEEINDAEPPEDDGSPF